MLLGAQRQVSGGQGQAEGAVGDSYGDRIYFQVILNILEIGQL